jgi:WD40 repeat protein
VVSGSEDDTLKIWEVSTGSLLRTISAYGGINGVSSVVFGPDGKTVIAGSSTKVRVWETQTGKQLRTLETREAHTSGDGGGSQMGWCCGSEVRVVRSSPDGRTIASAHEDGTIKLWGPSSDAPIRVIQARFPDLRALVFSPDGKLIASGYNEGGQPYRFVVGTNRKVNKKVRYRPIACARWPQSGWPHGRLRSHVRRHQGDAKTGKLLRQFKQPFSETDQVAFSPDSSRVVSGGENQKYFTVGRELGKTDLEFDPLPTLYDELPSSRRADPAAAGKRQSYLITYKFLKENSQSQLVTTAAISA